MADNPQTLQDCLAAMSVQPPFTQSHRTFGLPVAQLRSCPRRTANHYTVTTIDRGGRLADRSALRVLGWRPLQSISITPIRGEMILATSAPGKDVVTRQRQLRLPTPIRRAFRLTPGTRLLVVACPEPGMVAVYPAASLDAILLAHHRGELS